MGRVGMARDGRFGRRKLLELVVDLPRASPTIRPLLNRVPSARSLFGATVEGVATHWLVVVSARGALAGR